MISDKLDGLENAVISHMRMENVKYEKRSSGMAFDPGS